MDEGILEKLLEVNSLNRHDFMNHLQVIYGYLQLGHTQKARDYTLQAAKSIRCFDVLANIRLPYVKTILIWYLNLLGKEKSSLSVCAGEAFTYWQEFDYEAALLLMKILDFFRERLQKNEISGRVSFKTGDKVCIVLTLQGLDAPGKSESGQAERLPAWESENFTVRSAYNSAGDLLLVMEQKAR
jgi:hypothetical protein